MDYYVHADFFSQLVTGFLWALSLVILEFPVAVWEQPHSRVTDTDQVGKPFNPFHRADTDVQAVSNGQIGAYIEKCMEKGVSQGTLSTTVRHLKVFLRYIADDYDVSYVLRKVRVPKMPKKNLRIYTDTEIVVIFQSIRAASPWLTYHNCALVALMLDSGLRQAEVCGLLKKDVNFDSNILKVCGKGNKERVVPLGRLACYYLEAYQDACPYSGSEHVFVGRRGQDLTCDAVKHMISKLAVKLPFEFSSHKLRHNFATNYCLDRYERYGQVDIYRLMILMGHEDINTTRRYLHFANQLIAVKTNISHIDGILLKDSAADVI